MALAIATIPPLLSKQQADNTSWWDGAAFDRILLDAPCSGTGVMRRHPDIKFRRNPKNSLQFATQQNALLQQCWAMLGNVKNRRSAYVHHMFDYEVGK